MRKTKTKRKNRNKNKKHNYLTKLTRKLYSKKMRTKTNKKLQFFNKIIGGAGPSDFNEYLHRLPSIPTIDSQEMFIEAYNFVFSLNIKTLDALISVDDTDIRKKYDLLLWYFIIQTELGKLINTNIAENIAEIIAKNIAQPTLNELLIHYKEKEKTREDEINFSILSHFTEPVFTQEITSDFYVFSCRKYSTMYNMMYKNDTKNWVDIFHMNSYFSTTFLLDLAIQFCKDHSSDNNFIICIKIPKETTKGICLIAKAKVDLRVWIKQFNSEYEFFMPPCGILSFTGQFYKDVMHNKKQIPIYNYQERLI